MDGVSFEVRANETVGIVGESGSGRSLTARAVLDPTANLRASGSIKFGGSELLTASERQLSKVRGTGISVVLQDPFTMLSPMRKARTHVEEMLRAADGHGFRIGPDGLRRTDGSARLEYAARPGSIPVSSSGGMAQRIGLAAALAGTLGF